jgi:GNAT superfamily N-acetyltransferase
MPCSASTPPHAGGARGPATSLERSTWETMLGTPDMTVYLAETGGRPVGTASLLVMPNLGYGCAPSAFVEAVVVIPRARRRGIATAMMEQALADARGLGCNKVQLLSHKRHAADGAHDLYRSLGFEAEAEGFRLYLGPRPDR